MRNRLAISMIHLVPVLVGALLILPASESWGQDDSPLEIQDANTTKLEFLDATLIEISKDACPTGDKADEAETQGEAETQDRAKKQDQLELRSSGGDEYHVLIAAETKILAGGIPINVEGITAGSDLRIEAYCPDGVGQLKNPCGCTALSIQLVAARGVWRHTLTFGAELSQEEGDFSQLDAVLAYSSDTLWKQWGKNNKNRVHTFLDLGLLAVPNEQVAAPQEPTEGQENGESEEQGNNGGNDDGNGGDGQNGELDTFLSSRKSLSFQLGAYWVREIRQPDDILNLGFIAVYGFQSLTDQETQLTGDGTPVPGTEDTAKSFGAAGFRFAHHKRVPIGVNPEIDRSVELLYGYWENFLSEDQLREAGHPDPKNQRYRFVIRGKIRFPGTVPIFAGVVANLGRGKDDLRVFLAMRLEVEKLIALLPKP